MKKKDNLEKKFKHLIDDNSQLKADIIQTNDQIKKYENSIKQEQKKVISKIFVIEYLNILNLHTFSIWSTRGKLSIKSV